MKYIESERLILKVAQKEDAPIILDYFIRNKEFLQEWSSKKDERFYLQETHEEHINNDIKNYNEKTGIRYWIFVKGDMSKTIGTVNFSNIIMGAFRSCHLGYSLDETEINKGYITEAISKGIKIIFNHYKLHRIEANIMPRNKRSIRVVEKLGFYEEGYAVKYLSINDIWEDHIHMVLRNIDME